MGLSSHQSVSHLGTAPFANVWENICLKIFGGEDIEGLKRYSRPRWTQNGAGSETPAEEGPLTANNRLIPDVVCTVDGMRIIIDAKYYIPEVSSGTITGQPGSYDIVKEYFYQLLVDAYHYSHNGRDGEPGAKVNANVFMMPRREPLTGSQPMDDDMLIRIRGTAELPFLDLYHIDGVGGVPRLLPHHLG